MKYIKLTNNKKAIVDEEDYKYLNRFRWYATNKNSDRKWYAQMNKQYNNNKFVVMMYEFIIDLENVDCISFVNGNSLDYRKENLIGVSKSFMCQRSIKRRTLNATSKYKGLTFRKKKGVWEVRIAKDKKSYFIGSFKSEKEAAKAYNQKAIELFGKYAYQNNV